MHGVVLTLHQVMRYQSPDGKYTVDIRGDQSQARRCHSICIFDEASTSATKEKGELEQLQDRLPAYLKKVENEVDEPTATIENLVEVVLEKGE